MRKGKGIPLRIISFLFTGFQGIGAEHRGTDYLEVILSSH